MSIYHTISSIGMISGCFFLIANTVILATREENISRTFAGFSIISTIIHFLLSLYQLRNIEETEFIETYVEENGDVPHPYSYSYEANVCFKERSISILILICISLILTILSIAL